MQYKYLPGSRVLTIDIGGTHVKFEVGENSERREFKSGKHLSAKAMVAKVKEMTVDWRYDVVAIGYPGVVTRDLIIAEPRNLGKGWKAFDFATALERPTKILNDAAMQALGSYQGGKMLFLGLGTGLGSAMLYDGKILPMELAHLPYRKGHTFEHYVGGAALKRLKRKRWRENVRDVISRLSAALQPDYIVIGGGNAEELGALPKNVRIGNNDNAFVGGRRLWGSET